MKKLIDLTDEDALLVIQLMKPLEDIELIGRFGIHDNWERSTGKIC
jgi:hypothetical protein